MRDAIEIHPERFKRAVRAGCDRYIRGLDARPCRYPDGCGRNCGFLTAAISDAIVAWEAPQFLTTEESK